MSVERITFTDQRNTERVFKNETTMKVNEIEKEHPGDFSKIAHLAKDLITKHLSKKLAILQAVYGVVVNPLG